MRASWGAAVAERANECADAIDALRGPGGLASLREHKKGGAQPFPFEVRFARSAEEGAGPLDGDFIVYIPEGSLSANGRRADPSAFGLLPYESAGYRDIPGWYGLPCMESSGTYWLNFAFAPAEDPPFECDIDTSAQWDGTERNGAICRSVALAEVTVVVPGGGGASAGSVAVRQTTKGPLSYDFGVEALNGMMGDLAVEADPDRHVTVDGTEIYASVTADRDAGKILVGIADRPPEDADGGDSYCNDISHDSGSGTPPDNDISTDGDGLAGASLRDRDGNAISRWPCRKQTKEQA